jgi:hypothetical protein
MVHTTKETPVESVSGPEDEKAPWTKPRIESADIGRGTAASNTKVVHENPNSLS